MDDDVAVAEDVIRSSGDDRSKMYGVDGLPSIRIPAATNRIHRRCGDTMGEMVSPHRVARVRIDRQGRLVLPQYLRDEFVEVPGELLLERTAEGLLLRPVHAATRVRIADDGLPVLDVDRIVTNEEILAAIDRNRDER
jgi:bifunctional DNA-binding transcriptional regulator/antitoxin component of YhaV-PrlF toxin-antitoxin module